MPFEKLQLFCSWRISWNHSILWNLLSYDSFFSLFWKKFVKSKQEEVYSHAPHLVLHNFSHFLRNIACKKFAKTVKKKPLNLPQIWPQKLAHFTLKQPNMRVKLKSNNYNANWNPDTNSYYIHVCTYNGL